MPSSSDNEGKHKVSQDSMALPEQRCAHTTIEVMHKVWHFRTNLVFTVYYRDMSGKEMEHCMEISDVTVLLPLSF